METGINKIVQVRLDNLYNLKHIIRYNNVQKIQNESVAEHTFFVMAAVMELYNFYDFNLGDALKMALVHDYPEIYVDDVAHPVKKMFPKVAEVLKEAEQESLKYFSETVGKYFTRYADHNCMEALVVNLADMISVAQYCKSEQALGNKGWIMEVASGSDIIIKDRYNKIEEIKRCEPLS